jgi:ribosomal protein S27AE
MKPPLEPCDKCGANEWKAIKQHSEILGYRCARCGEGVVWNPKYMGGDR